MGDVILTMKGIDKSFPGVHALDHVDLEVRRGEVHALMGENGAGKSTLMKVLTGIYKKDSGTITYEGREVEFQNTREAQDAGVVIVHQELNMVGDLTVAQNIFIGREPKKGIRNTVLATLQCFLLYLLFRLTCPPSVSSRRTWNAPCGGSPRRRYPACRG